MTQLSSVSTTMSQLSMGTPNWTQALTHLQACTTTSVLPVSPYSVIGQHIRVIGLYIRVIGQYLLAAVLPYHVE